MKGVWYIYSNQVVSGPYSTENVEKGLTAQKWPLDSLVWCKGQVEWLTLTTWKLELPKILENLKTSVQQTVWYVEHLGIQKGPMNASELQQYVDQNGLIASCRVWTTGMESWMSIFELPELIDFMGITRRKSPRAPIKGEAQIQTLQTQIIAPLGTISEGGIGVRKASGVVKGDSIEITIKSPMLVEPIYSRATVVYANPSGTTGLEFQSLPAEFQSAIVYYVKQFKS